jgi:hypothetical protein
MKPFDSELALAGAKVVTRDGREVTQLRQLTGVSPEDELCGVCDGMVRTWHKQGNFCRVTRPHILDLFMAAQTRTGWVNIYPHDNERYYISGICDTEEEAKAAAGSGLIACIKIEWEK